MKHLLTFLILTYSVLAFGQKSPCKYDLDEYDKFKKVRKLEKVVKVVKTVLRDPGYLDIELCKYGNTLFFRIYTADRYKSITVGKSDKLMFLLDDEETITASPYDIYSSHNNGYQHIFKGTYDFEDVEEDFKKLKLKKIKLIRLYFNDVYKDFDIKKGNAEDFMKAANCF